MGLNLKKGGGGFLNGVDGVIAGYRWTDEFNGEAFVPGKKPGTKDDKFHSLFLEISARLDGADEDITQNLFAGNADEYDYEDDQTLKNVEEDAECGISNNSPAGKFLASLVEAGFPLSAFGDDPLTVNLEPMVGTRVRFGQAVVIGKDGKPKKRVAKKGKFKGKEFDDTTTVIEQVYERAGKAGKASKTEKTGKTSGKKAKDEEADESDDVETLASNFLIKVVTAAKGKLAKAKLSMALLKEENGMSKHPEREPIRKLLKSDDFLETENGWSYDAKKEIITVDVD